MSRVGDEEGFYHNWFGVWPLSYLLFSLIGFQEKVAWIQIVKEWFLSCTFWILWSWRRWRGSKQPLQSYSLPSGCTLLCWLRPVTRFKLSGSRFSSCNSPPPLALFRERHGRKLARFLSNSTFHCNLPAFELCRMKCHLESDLHFPIVHKVAAMQIEINSGQVSIENQVTPTQSLSLENKTFLV